MRSNRGRRKFVVCIRNEGYPASLELRKIYEQLPDPRGEELGFIRVADEEDDALYPAKNFISIRLPREIEDAVVSAAEMEAVEASS